MTLQERLEEREGWREGVRGGGGHARDYIDDRDETETDRAPRPEARQHDAKREKPRKKE